MSDEERLTRERDEAREALRLSVSAWEAAGMQGRSAHDAILVLQRRAEQAEAALDIERAALTAHAVESECEHDEGIHSCHDRCSRPACVMRRERDEARAQVKAWQDEELERRRERDEARAQLAALREAAGPHAASEYASDSGTRVLRIVLADAEDAAEAYTRRVRAEALREAAACTVDGLRLWGRKAQGDASEWLRARADEIGRGAR